MLMGPFLNSHYWPMTVCPQVGVALMFGLDVDDSCPSKLQSGRVQILITAEGPGGCLLLSSHSLLLLSSFCNIEMNKDTEFIHEISNYSLHVTRYASADTYILGNHALAIPSTTILSPALF